MKQSELYRPVAAATGESVSAVRQLGFTLDRPTDVCTFHDDDLDFGPNVVDWDEVDAQHNATRAWSVDDAMAMV